MIADYLLWGEQLVEISGTRARSSSALAEALDVPERSYQANILGQCFDVCSSLEPNDREGTTPLTVAVLFASAMQCWRIVEPLYPDPDEPPAAACVRAGVELDAGLCCESLQDKINFNKQPRCYKTLRPCK